MSLGPFTIVVASPISDPLAGKADQADLQALSDAVDLLPTADDLDGKLAKSANLSDVADPATARGNIGAASADDLAALSRAPRIVATFADRDGIPIEDRFDGMLVKVVEADQWFQWDGGAEEWVAPLEFVQNTVLFASPPIIDQGTIYFPEFRVLQYRQNGYGTFYVPTGGSAFLSQASSTADVRRHVFDLAAFAGGASAAESIIEVDGNDAPLTDTRDKVILAVSVNGKIVDDRGYPFAGDMPGGAVANQFRYGKLVDETPFIYPGDVPADVTDTDLNALGFTRGIRGVANSIVGAGGYLDENPRIGDFVVCRFFLHTTVAGQFGQPRLWHYESEPTASYVVPVLLREISSTVREYFYSGRITQADRLKWAVGTDNQANASVVTIVGIQYHVGSDPSYWIGRNDYPEPLGWGSGADPLMSDELFMVSDRPLPLIPANGLAKRSLPAQAEITTLPILDLPAQPYFEAGRAADLYWLDPAAMSDNLRLTMRGDDSAAHMVATRTAAVSVKTVPVEATAIKCIYFGDSLSNGNFSPDLKALLAAWGVDITFYGTLANDAGEYAEGRGGWSIANYVGMRQGAAWTSVVGAGTPAASAYLAGDYVARFNTQPFLNNGTSGSAAPVVPGSLPLLGGGTASGFRFDLVNYRTRFALPTDIDIVLLNLWSNDMNLVPASDGLADVVAYYPVLLAEIRRAWPDAIILCWASAPGFVNNAEIRWRERRPALRAIKAAIKTRQLAGDANLHFCSAWMHHTVRSSFDLAAGATDAVTGVNRAIVADDIHTSRPADAQAHEAVAAAIINLIGG